MLRIEMISRCIVDQTLGSSGLKCCSIVETGHCWHQRQWHGPCGLSESCCPLLLPLHPWGPELHFSIHLPCPPRFCPRHTGKPVSDRASPPSSPAVSISLPPPLAGRIRVAVSAAVSQLVMHEAAMRMAAMRGTGTQGEAQGMGVFRQSAMRLLGWLDKVRQRASRHVIDRVDCDLQHYRH